MAEESPSPKHRPNSPFSANKHPCPAEPAQPPALCPSNRVFSELLGTMILFCHCRPPAGF